MDINALIETHGYTALFVGCFLEGETPLILAGFAAQRGLLKLHWVWVVAFFGALLGDQFFFCLGRLNRDRPLKYFRWLREPMAKVAHLLDKRRVLVLLGFRFFYGFRAVTPFVVGAGSIPGWTFLFWNAAGAVLWAIGVGSAGYFFGAAIEKVFARIKEYETVALGVLAGLAFLFWLHNQHRKRKSRRDPELEE